MQNLVILHIAALSFKKSSGLTTSVPQLVNAQNQIEGIRAALIISQGEKPKDWNPMFNVFVYSQDFDEISLVDLPKPFNKPDLVVFHSTYIPIHAKIAKSLKKIDIPYIIVPRGGMTNGSQKVKRMKKVLGNVVFFNKFVKNSLALHCLTEGELLETKFWNKQSFVVGNGMDLKKLPKRPGDSELNKLRFVFIGRLDPYHKGLDLFIFACFKVKDILEKENCIIEIYGPDINGSYKYLSSKIKEMDLERVMKIFPPVYDEEKDSVLRKTDVFVHTSRFEGHPMSVLEALSYGIPCLLTPGTNISKEVEHAEVGWEVELNVSDIAEGIKKVIENKNMIKEMSPRAIKFIEDNYTWKKVASDTIEEYRLLLSK